MFISYGYHLKMFNLSTLDLLQKTAIKTIILRFWQKGGTGGDGGGSSDEEFVSHHRV